MTMFTTPSMCLSSWAARVRVSRNLKLLVQLRLYAGNWRVLLGGILLWRAYFESLRAAEAKNATTINYRSRSALWDIHVHVLHSGRDLGKINHSSVQVKRSKNRFQYMQSVEPCGSGFIGFIILHVALLNG